MDKRFEETQANLDKRFEQVGQRFDEMIRRYDRHFLWLTGFITTVGGLVIAARKLWLLPFRRAPVPRPVKPG